MYKGFLRPFRGYRRGSRLLRGVRRAVRAARPNTHRRGCCCCPAFLMLGLAGLGLVAGSLYAGIRFLPLLISMM